MANVCYVEPRTRTWISLQVSPTIIAGLHDSRVHPIPGRDRANREVDMAEPTEEEIRTYAHQLWEKAGRPEGRDKEFWDLAEQELRNQDKASPLRTPDNL